MKAAKIKDPKREAAKIAKINKTVNIDEQKVLEFRIAGHSSDKVCTHLFRVLIQFF